MRFKTFSEVTLSLPLTAIDAVAIDSETTGLNPKTDRVIELAGVAIHAGKVLPEENFQTLIDPKIPIPSKSTKIHTITDEETKGKPDFKESFASFSSWINGRFILGFSLGFDFSIFEQEHLRHDLVWREPLSLDVEELIHVIKPNLPNYSLETVATWLNVEIKDRHRALPDAIITANVFIKLIPILREAGILTFGEARRSAGEIKNRRGGFSRYQEAVQSNIVHFDTYPYRIRVEDIMKPPTIVNEDLTLQKALDSLVAKKIGSLIVRLENHEYGILTESDIIRAIQHTGSSTLQQNVGRFCSKPLEFIHKKEFVYRAIVTMGSRKFHRLAICNDEREIIGVISSSDIFGNYSFEAIGLGKDILEANTPEELGVIWSGLASVTHSLVLGGTDSRTIAAIISRELRGITKRACVIAESEILSQSNDNRNPDYAMMVLGSGGRGESLLAMDQDNAIIYSSDQSGSQIDSQLESIAKRVSDILNQTGIVYCPGGVMASNKQWRRDKEDWKDQVKFWITRTKSENLLNSDIFFDLMPVHGNELLANQLRNEAIQLAMNAKPFLSLLSLRASNFTIPLGVFNRIKSKDGRLDLKISGIMPIFSTARIVALRHGLRPRSTGGRLRVFKKMNKVPDQLIDNLLSAHEIFLELILRQQIMDFETGLKLSNRVDTKNLPGIHLQKLKWALDKLHTIPNVLGTPV